jgi:hypothetical protein
MSAIVFLIEQLAVGLYILIGVAIGLTVRSLTKSRAAYRGTYFELERDIARYQSANALTVLVLLIELGLVVLGVQRIVAPTVRQTTNTAQTFQQVIDDGTFITPTPFALAGGAPIDASGVQLEEEDPALQVLATPTLTPTPVGTIMPNAPAPIGCDTPNAQLQVPASGMVVFEPVTVIGTANTDNFAFYRFEIKGPSTFENFAPSGGDHSLPVSEPAELGSFVPAFYEPGEYQFKLTVFDVTNTLKASCEVTIAISDPIPTPTPLGQNLPPATLPPVAGGTPQGD